jgi:hypothetical protein
MAAFPCISKVVCDCADDQVSRNFSAEAPDPFMRFALVFFAGQPPLNAPPDDYVTPVGVGGCFALTQEEADDCALRDVQERVWGPWQPPGNGIFSNTAQTCLIPCANGAPDFEYTVPAGTFLAHTQAEADALAASYCRNRGTRIQECLLPPAVITGDASALTATSATLNGTVNPNGVPTIAYFEYGSTAAYGNVTPIAAMGDGIIPLALAAPVTGLSPGTYHCRIVATSSSGTSHGADKTFILASVCVSPGFWNLGLGVASSWGIAAAGGKTINVDASANLNRFNGATLENTLNFFKLASDSGLGALQAGFIVTTTGAFFAAADVGRTLHWVTQAVRYLITGFTSPTQVTVDTSNAIGTNRDSSASAVTATQALDVVTASGAFFLAGDVGKNLRWHTTGDTFVIIAFISATQVQVDTSNPEAAQAFSVEQFFDLDVEAYTIGGSLTTARINETGDIATSITSGGSNLVRFNTTAPGVPVIVAATGAGRMNAAGHVMGTNATYYYKNGTTLATGITLAIFNGSAAARDKGRYIAQATDKYIEFQRNALLGQTLRVWDNGVLTNVTPSPLPPLPLFGAAQTIQGRVVSPGGSCVVTVIGSDSGTNRTFWFITDLAGYSQQISAPLSGVGSVSSIYQINDAKQAVGSVNFAAGFGPALFAGNGVVTAVALFGANTGGELNSINASGIAVGYQSAAGVNTAFLYKNGIVYNLNDYLPASFVALGWYLSIADVITDDGYILGRGKLGGVDASWLMCVSALA